MKIEYLFPEISNLFGESGNIRYLKACLKASGVPYEIIETGIHDTPAFVSERPNLVYMGAMTEESQEIAIAALRPWKEKLIEQIEQNTCFLITGNALEIFGSRIENEDGSSIEGLNLFPTVAERRMLARFNSLYWGKFAAQGETLDIFGFKSQFTHSMADETIQSHFVYAPLFQTVEGKGPGLNPQVAGEGILSHRFMATYVIGPLLIVNPLFTVYLMKELGVSDPVLAWKEEIMAAYQARKVEFTAPGKGYYYYC